MYWHHNRPAIAMIELIFAIVVMGIVLMSAPMLISTASESSSVALQQEGINEASSRVNMILTHEWDQNDLNDSCIPPVLQVTNGATALNEVGTTGRRAGVPLTSNSHTFKCGNTELNASVIGAEGGAQDDIDDFGGATTLVLENSGSDGTDYIEQTTVHMATAISYIADVASPDYSNSVITYAPSAATGGGTTNIKEISVTLTSSSTLAELTKTITMKAFSCNIGGFEYESKGF